MLLVHTGTGTRTSTGTSADTVLPVVLLIPVLLTSTPLEMKTFEPIRTR
jgi:hypothetical protein